jgi:hypothetical protein
MKKEYAIGNGACGSVVLGMIVPRPESSWKKGDAPGRAIRIMDDIFYSVCQTKRKTNRNNPEGVIIF